MGFRAGRKIKVISPDALKPGDEVVSCCYFGSPTVMVEMIGSGEEMTGALALMHSVLAERRQLGKVNFAACYSAEAGGTNALEPLVAAAINNIPFLDADGMGRAYPRLELYLPYHLTDRYGPITMCGARGEPTLHEVPAREGADATLRQHVFETHGGVAGIALPPLTAEEVRTALVPHSISLCWRIGRAVHDAHVDHKNAVRALLDIAQGRLLGVGTIMDAPARESMWSSGNYTFVLERDGAAEDDSGMPRSLLGSEYGEAIVHYVNEYLLVHVAKPRGGGEPVEMKLVASTPDLIVLLDPETARAYHCDEVRFGMRLAIAQLAAPEQYKGDSSAAKAVEPAGFVSDFGALVRGPMGDVKPETLEKARTPVVSVCDEYATKN